MPQTPRKPGLDRARGVVRRLRDRVAAPQAAPAVAPAGRQPEGPDPKAHLALTRFYWKVGRALRGAEAMPPAARDARYDDDLAADLLDRLRLHRALSTYGDLVARGEDHAAAHVATIRALIESGHRPVARSYSMGLGGTPHGEDLLRVGLALCLQAVHWYPSVWAQLRPVDPAFLARHVPVEAVGAALMNGSSDAVEAARAVAADPSALRTSALPQMAGRFLVAGQDDVARRLYDEARGRDDLHEWDCLQLDNLRRWLEPAPAPEAPAGRIRIGVFDYYQPDLLQSSGNIGDYVQTLSMLGNLARFQQVKFHGADGLGDLVNGLQGRVRPELRLDGPAADVELLPVSRDYSEGDPVPEDTWLVAFGWHMHSLYKLRYGLPYHEHLNPVFVAFHVNRVDALTPEAIDYLKAHGPIGCRDWATVDLLLGAGVDAFFTGCLTSTVNAVFPPRDQVEKDEQMVVAAIDVTTGNLKAKRPVESITHADPEWREMDLVSGVHSADELLQTYLRRFHRVVTSRLHSYLPATSLGIPVTFRPKVRGDVRFEGLHGMTPDGEAFVEMRDGIRALLAEVFTLVLAGAAREEVYARWRELTAERVAEARAKHEAPPQPLAPELDLGGLVAQVRESAHRYGPHDAVDPATVTDVALSLDHNFRHLLPVTLESITSNAKGPLRIWVTSRGLDERYRTWLTGAFPEVPFTFLDYDGVDYGVITRMIKHITVATMDRLLLPEVLPDLPRITYVDIDTVTLGDVAELARTDLGGFPLAARTSIFSAAQIWRAAGDVLDPDDAHELRRTMTAAHGHDFRTFNAGVLVLDLERMRRDRFVERFVPMATRFGLNDQDVLIAYTGPQRHELDPAWNALPAVEPVEGARIVHYAGAGKPWEDGLVPEGHLWRRYAEQFAARAGEVPDQA